ncbi:MAG: flagellar basal body P-ring protein FlgI [Candidatus Omnitrophica bacterium]|nr:flagellar basal body P-ring protein FlgI [Candidatus Omnitrophota bacterium]
MYGFRNNSCVSVRMFIVFIGIMFLFVGHVHAAVRLKDIAYFQGARENQLMGYGLVVGLNGTGDKSQSVFTVKSIASLLLRLGIKIDPSKISPKNVAAVMVTANLPPFIKPGARIDIALSSLGDASSLQGGTLLLTPLQGADGAVYAVAQGQVSVGGFESGRGGRGDAFGTVARIPQGALIEREVPVTLIQEDTVSLSLKKIDFTTCIRASEAINVAFHSTIAEALDGATVRIRVPEIFRNNIVKFLARIEHIKVEPDTKAKIVINERTGTIVGGKDVKISRVSLTHKDINVEIKPSEEVEKISDTTEKVSSYMPSEEALFVEDEETVAQNAYENETTVGEVAQILNSLGIKPRDMITIFQTIKEAGAIQAELEIM